MSSKQLDSKTEYGTDGLAETLEIARTTSTQVFNPILERRAQGEKIKSTLAVLERFKFFFNLPSTIQGAIHHGNLEAAVRDFKKGRHLIQSLYPGILGEPERPVASSNVILKQQRRLFENIWQQVTQVMMLVKNRLFKQLGEHTAASVDEQEQAIALILEIDPTSDPVWFYMESRYKWIILQLKEKISLHYRSLSGAQLNAILNMLLSLRFFCPAESD
jgi:exocyst complex component 2